MSSPAVEMPVLKRKRGRPRVANPLRPITITLPENYLQRIYRLADKSDLKASAAIRQILIVTLDKNRK